MIIRNLRYKTTGRKKAPIIEQTKEAALPEVYKGYTVFII